MNLAIWAVSLFLLNYALKQIHNELVRIRKALEGRSK